MTLDARELLNWRYGVCPIGAAAERFGPFAPVVDLWRGRIPDGRLLPGRGAFDVVDFKPWLGRIFIARVEREPFDLRFVLWGVTLSAWWGVDYTNKTLGSESNNPELWRLVELAYFQEMERAPFIGLSHGYLDQHDRSHIKVMGLDLPLGEGDRLEHVLSFHMRIELKQTPESLMPDCPIERYF